MREPLKIGILGLSRIASDHALAASNLGFEIFAAGSGNSHSPRLASFTQLVPECKIIPSEVLLSADWIDILISCLPLNLANDFFPQLVSNPKRMLIEKPPFLPQADTNFVHAHSPWNAEKWVGFNKRFLSSVQELKNILSFSKPVSVDVIVSESSENIISKQLDASRKDYLFYSSTSHILDLCLYLFGNLKLLSAREVSRNSNHSGFEAILLTQTECEIKIKSFIDFPSPIGFWIFLESGEYCVLSPLEKLTIFKGYEIYDGKSFMNYREYRPKVQRSVYVESLFRPGILEQMIEVSVGNRKIGASLTDFTALHALIISIRNFFS